MTEQQLIMWARSLTFGQVVLLVCLIALGWVAIALICVAVSQFLPVRETEYIEEGEE